ncbi:olfactory receptor 6C74-like [Tachyglossus aculeatus]|uniref:olfactory receptor 6C74-like n=1 Tax=Tachyglossus aculeatus TaxID=9261 RepID=UPI0018F70432|nr:olfactory receptor 6C74-like [Tachyglossus aculeatus]
MRNHTQVNEFILLGLTDDPDLQTVILFCMSVTYILNIIGNLSIVTLTLLDSHLHTPMYFFLRCFFLFLPTISTGDRTISCNCCPLHYTTVMSQNVCTLPVLCSWLTGFLVIFPLIILGLQLDFCEFIDIDHFFYDVSPMLLFSCSDTWFLELMAFILALRTQLVTLVLVAVSYTAIARTILRLPSAHCILMHIKPSANDMVDLTKGVTVLNTSVALMLNLFIYNLGN